MKLFLDANVILETLLPGRKYAAQAESYTANPDAIISPLTAHLYVYFGQRGGIDTSKLLANLDLFNYSDIDDSTVRWAIQNCVDGDFEDALQIASAILSGCDTFVTLDRRLVSQYKTHIEFKLLGTSL